MRSSGSSTEKTGLSARTSNVLAMIGFDAKQVVISLPVMATFVGLVAICRTAAALVRGFPNLTTARTSFLDVRRRLQDHF